jgi:hypothetical protein
VSNELAAGKLLERLDSLKKVIQELTARADKSSEEYRTRTAKERQRTGAAVEEQNLGALASQAEAEAAFQTAKATAESNYQKRKDWLGRAYQSSRERALRKVDDDTGGRKYELQKRALQAERDRDAALSDTASDFEEFRRNLTAEGEKLSLLERDVQRAFGGYGRFSRRFLQAYEKIDVDATRSHKEMFADVQELLLKAAKDLQEFRRFTLLRIFRFRTFWSLIVVCALLVPLASQQLGLKPVPYPVAGGAALAIAVLVLGLRLFSQTRAGRLADSLSSSLARAHRLHDLCLEKSETHRQQELERLRNEFQTTAREMDQQLKRVVAHAAEGRVSTRMASDERTVRIGARNDRMHRARLERLERDYAETVRQLKASAEESAKSVTSLSEQQQKKLTDDYQSGWKNLEAEWKTMVFPLYESLASANVLTQKLFPPWDAPELKSWKPPGHFVDAARFAQLNVELEKFCQALPKDKRLALPGPSQLSLPLCLGFPSQGSILLETGATGHDQAVAALNNTILRLLSVSPPGRLNFTIIDPVGLGQNFAGVMHLADYEEQMINNRIWTQSSQIEQKLADLNEHMEKVIQMYLRNEYATIAEYNEQAGVIAEKYYFLVIADFPSNFTDVAAKRLMSIAASGARCGVYMLLHWDQRQPMPQDFLPDEVRKNCVVVTAKGNDFLLSGKSQPGMALQLDNPPTPEFAIEFVNQVGRASRDSSRVEVPFAHVIPPEKEVWTEDTTSELRVPIGRTGATKLQYLEIGKGTRQHGLVAGKTGSGKSTLFHVIITNLALWCSPEQVEFYLVDFKKGVEFKCYASRRLPHARVVAIESDREFGLSVLQRVDDELRRRGDMFRSLGVQDIAGYKRAGGKEAIPRTLLLIDEFQEFFVEDDKVSQTASLLLDRIVRQGRAFGIHVLLGSQTLGGAYTVARTTLGQMVIRIALQCNEADAYLIMDDTNPAPRLLSRPGEGIYNDMAGALEGNSPFQVVWLPDEERDTWLSKVRTRADGNGALHPGPIVFEGNAPANIRENTLLQVLLDASSIKAPAAGRLWLGAPNSIKGPTEATFNRQTGNNLLIVGQREEETLAMFCIGLISLAAQYPVGAARFILCDATPPDSNERRLIERTVELVRHPVTLAKPGDLPEILGGLSEEMKKRSESSNSDAAPPVFLMIHGLQRFSRLRFDEELSFSSDPAAASNPAMVLNNLVTEGTRLGFHVIASCDSYNNVSRYLSRKAFSEFEMRVLFQMSANDSASLIDNPKASMLGLHRALYFNAQEGYLETFRPYALPGTDWFEDAGRHLSRLLN